MIENDAYLNLLLVFNGVFRAEQLMETADDALQNATLGYGIGNWHYMNGREERAMGIWQQIYDDLDDIEVIPVDTLEKAIEIAVNIDKNEKIELNTDSVDIPKESLKLDKSIYDTPTLNVYLGPEFYKLSKTIQYQLFNAEFSLSSIQNRMAYQVQEKLSNELDEIITGPVLPGTIQFTPSGKMIVLMRDAQVTGGYPRILQLSENSINVLAQKRTKSRIKFKLIEIGSENF